MEEKIGYGEYNLLLDNKSNTFTLRCIGDSLYGNSSSGNALMASVSKWLRIQFGFHAKMEGDCLSHGIQRDTFNCGPAAINTIEHIALGRELWTPTTAVYHRVAWFIQLIKGHDVDVPTPQDGCAKIKTAIDSEHEASQPNTKNPKPEVDLEMENTSRLQENIEDSIDIAVGDHNFPNLAQLLASSASPATDNATTSTGTKMSLTAILSPTSTTVPSSVVPAPNFKLKPNIDFSHHRPSETPENSDFSIHVDVEMTPINDLPVTMVCKASMEKTDKKRQRHNSTNSSQSSDGCTTDTPIPKKPRAGDGKSASAKASLARRESLREGTLVISMRKLEKWKKKILKDDENATFDSLDIRQVRHSGCGKFFRVKEAYDLTRWRTHLKTCSKKPAKKSSNTKTLFSMGSWKLGKLESSVKTKAASSVEESKPPCPGLTEDNDEKIPEYLRRTTASGGGSKRIHDIAKDMFGRLFKALKNSEKEQVLQNQSHSQRWRNDHRSLRVYSTSCEKSVMVDKRGNRSPGPCPECASLLNLKAFREVLRKPTPKPKNQIYTNKLHRLPVLGSLYAKHIGLRDIVETPVRIFL